MLSLYVGFAKLGLAILRGKQTEEPHFTNARLQSKIFCIVLTVRQCMLASCGISTHQFATIVYVLHTTMLFESFTEYLEMLSLIHI